MFWPVVFGVLYAWPALERRFTGDRGRHDLPDRPLGTAIAAAFLSRVVILCVVGSTDRLSFRLHISYGAMIRFWRSGVRVVPAVVFFITRSGARSRKRSESHALRGWQGTIVTRDPGGEARTLETSENATAHHEPPVGTVPAHDYPEQAPQG